MQSTVTVPATPLSPPRDTGAVSVLSGPLCSPQAVHAAGCSTEQVDPEWPCGRPWMRAFGKVTRARPLPSCAAPPALSRGLGRLLETCRK